MSEIDLQWARPEDRQWADRLRLRLALGRGVPLDVVEEVLAEAHQAGAETGQPVEQLFGPADDYALEVAGERVPVEVRAEADLDGSTRRDQWKVLAYVIGGPGLVLSLLVLVREGWTVGITLGSLVLLLAVMVGMATAAWGMFERQAGQLARGWALWAGTLAVAVVGGWAAVSWQDLGPLGAVPALVPLALSLGLLVVGSRLPERAVTELPPESLPVEVWFGRLGGLLRGRYFLPRSAVARHVEEARAYWRESGTSHPAAEFGSPSVYALRLVQGSRHPERGRRRARAAGRSALAGVWLFLVIVTLVERGSPGELAWRLAGLGLFTVLAVRGWRGVEDRPVP